MEDSEPPSVFVVMYICSKEPHSIILQLETPKQIKKTSVAPEEMTKTNVDGLKLRFFQRVDLRWVNWSVSPPTTSTGDFYLLPSMCAVKPLCGYQFNFGTASFQNISLPPSITQGMTESIVNLRGRIYRMELHNNSIKSNFDCYDPQTNSWKPLKPLRHVAIDSRVYATAVWGDTDTILYLVGICGIWAYDVDGNEWYKVHSNDIRCTSIVGEGVVLGGTIYALTERKDAVLALSIEREESGNDLVFKCSVRSMILMPFISEDELISDETPMIRSTHLVHLGNTGFCLVEGCDPLYNKGPIPIHVTYMRLPEETEMTGFAGETKMTVLSDQWFETQHHHRSEVVLCFSLPKCKTAALNGGKHLAFELNPFIVVHHSIYVRDLRANVSVAQLEKGLKVFGSIKRGGIQVNRHKKGNSFAVVDFESMYSKKRAIESSSVYIGGFPAKISEKLRYEAA